MALILTDWRGNEYTAGTKIIYCTSEGSSSAKMTEGVIEDIFQVYYNDLFKYERFYPENPAAKEVWDKESQGYKRVPLEAVDLHTRIKVLVTNASNSWNRQKVGKSVTLTRTDHITVVSDG